MKMSPRLSSAAKRGASVSAVLCVLGLVLSTVADVAHVGRVDWLTQLWLAIAIGALAAVDSWRKTTETDASLVQAKGAQRL